MAQAPLPRRASHDLMAHIPRAAREHMGAVPPHIAPSRSICPLVCHGAIPQRLGEA